MVTFLLHKSKLQLLVILVYLCLTTFVILRYNLPFAPSSILFFLIPAIVILILDPSIAKRTLIASTASLPLGIVFDLLGSLNNVWYIPEASALFTFRLLNVVSIDGIIWFLSWILFVFTFYEHFFIPTKNLSISKYFLPSFFATCIILIIVSLIYKTNVQLLMWSHTYVIIILFNIPILVAAIVKNSSLMKAYLRSTFFFASVFFIFEIVGLYNQQWIFGGAYTFQFKILSFWIPIEEILFWIILSPSIVLSYYELCVIERVDKKRL